MSTWWSFSNRTSDNKVIARLKRIHMYIFLADTCLFTSARDIPQHWYRLILIAQGVISSTLGIVEAIDLAVLLIGVYRRLKGNDRNTRHFDPRKPWVCVYLACAACKACHCRSARELTLITDRGCQRGSTIPRFSFWLWFLDAALRHIWMYCE
jgi:hypothetical protein